VVYTDFLNALWHTFLYLSHKIMDPLPRKAMTQFTSFLNRHYLKHLSSAQLAQILLDQTTWDGMCSVMHGNHWRHIFMMMKLWQFKIYCPELKVSFILKLKKTELENTAKIDCFFEIKSLWLCFNICMSTAISEIRALVYFSGPGFYFTKFWQLFK